MLDYLADEIEQGRKTLLTMTTSQAFDDVTRPAHYARGAMEHCDTFESRAVVARSLPPGTERFLGGMEHNATKYVWRAGEKVEPGLTPAQQVLKDWSKARWYVDRGVKHLERLVETQRNGEGKK